MWDSNTGRSKSYGFVTFRYKPDGVLHVMSVFGFWGTMGMHVVVKCSNWELRMAVCQLFRYVHLSFHVVVGHLAHMCVSCMEGHSM